MAIGSGSEGANTALQEEHRGDLTFAEAEVLVLKTLKQVMEEKVGWFSCAHELPAPISRQHELDQRLQPSQGCTTRSE